MTTPGELREPVTIEYETRTQDDYGSVSTWATRAAVRSKVLDGGGRAFNEGGIDVARRKIFVIRPLSGLVMTDRVSYQRPGADAAARYYRILDIAPETPAGPTLYLHLWCEEITDAE